MKVDLHMHSTASDGTDTPEVLLEKVRAAGIGLFSVTDHDTTLAGLQIPGLLAPGDPAFVTGVEFASRDDKGRYHILGYGIDPENTAIKKLVDHTHDLRLEKAYDRLAFLKDHCRFTFDEADVKALFSLNNPGKPHIADMMIQYGYAPDIPTAITGYLNHAKIRPLWVDPGTVIDAILAAGGIPVLAHPVFGNGSQRLDAAELDRRIRELKAIGLMGLECYYSSCTPDQISQALALADQYDMLVSAGSDYHGAHKQVALGENHLPETDRPERFLKLMELLHNRVVKA